MAQEGTEASLRIAEAQEEGPAEKISRRNAVRRIGRFGLGATLAAGLTSLVSAAPAAASSCCLNCSLAVGHCGRPCPSGLWCYNCSGPERGGINGCGLGNGYKCVRSSGQQYTSFCFG